MTRNRTSTVLVLAAASMTLTTAVRPQEPSTLSLREVPRPVPAAAIIPARGRAAADDPIPGPDTPVPFRDLVAAGIVKDQAALSAWARRCSGTCRWAAMAFRPAPRAISARARIPFTGTRFLQG